MIEYNDILIRAIINEDPITYKIILLENGDIVLTGVRTTEHCMDFVIMKPVIGTLDMESVRKIIDRRVRNHR